MGMASFRHSGDKALQCEEVLHCPRPGHNNDRNENDDDDDDDDDD